MLLLPMLAFIDIDGRRGVARRKEGIILVLLHASRGGGCDRSTLALWER